ncbi:acyltransferase [Nakamurella sp. GG22]
MKRRTVVYKLPLAGSKVLRLWRGALLALRIRSRGGRVGRALQAERGVWLRRPPHSGWDIGRNVYFGRHCILEVPLGGRLEVGDSSRLMHNVLICAVNSVQIGQDVLIAERVSIRDQDHGTALGSTVSSQDVVTAPISIQNGVWVGCGAVVLRGSTLGSGCIVGALSVVKGNVDADVVVVGAPARPIALRRPAAK